MRLEFLIAFIMVGVLAIPPAEKLTIDELIAIAGDMKHGKVNPNGKNSPSGRKTDDGKGVITEYDIVLAFPEEADEIASSKRKKRAAIQTESGRWPSAIIPYTLPSNFTTASLTIIQQAIAEFDKYTCLRIRPRTTETDYVSVTNTATGCWSSVGRIGGAQSLSLSQSCSYSQKIVIHEFLHAAGCHHEQSRTDRDSYVTINYANILAGKAHNFNIRTNEITYGIGYDYRSVMHYGRAAFSTSAGSDTITTLDPAYQTVIGTTPTLSFADIRLVNSMYNCSSSCSPVNCPSSGFQGFNCLCFCPSTDPNNPVVNCGGGCLILNQGCNCQLRAGACSGIPNSVCNSVTKACVCASGYVLHNGRCTLITSITCTAPNIDCKCSLRTNACVGVSNTVCEKASNKCVCKPGFRIINGRCVAIVG